MISDKKQKCQKFKEKFPFEFSKALISLNRNPIHSRIDILHFVDNLDRFSLALLIKVQRPGEYRGSFYMHVRHRNFLS